LNAQPLLVLPGAVWPLKKSKAKKSVRRKKSDWALSLVHDVWPQERDFFERPERYRYVRKLLPETSECVFCAALKAGVGFESWSWRKMSTAWC